MLKELLKGDSVRSLFNSADRTAEVNAVRNVLNSPYKKAGEDAERNLFRNAEPLNKAYSGLQVARIRVP